MFSRATGFWPRYVGAYTVITALVFSALRYKTPWNLLPFYAGAVLMATAYPNRTAPVLRGAWILERMMGTPAAQPPPSRPPSSRPFLSLTSPAAKMPGTREATRRTRRAAHVAHGRRCP